MIDGLRVAVVVPAYREERLIARTLSTVPDTVDVVIVVDDASPDATFERATSSAERDARIDVVRLSENQGVGGAIVEGYRRAIEAGADVAVVMAGDDQMDPGDLPALVAPIAEDRADYVKGNRWVHAEARRMPLVRRIGSQVLGRTTGFIAGIPGLDDAQCGYTAVRLATLRDVPLDRVYPRYGYPNDMLLRLAAAGARIVQVPVRPVYGDEVSGFVPYQVVKPIAGILLRGALRRAGLLSDQ